MSGQANNLAPTSLDDVAELLFNEPGADSALDDRAPPETDDEPGLALDNSEPDLSLDAGNGDEQSDPGDTDGDEPDGDEASSPTSQKYKVRVVGADGAEQTEQVTLEELKASYLRHSDYTRKTMELGERERQATELVTAKLNEGRNHYLQEAAKSHQAIVMLAGIKSAEEMAHLAQTDPGSYVAEKARVEAIQGVLHQIEQGMRANAQALEAKTLEQRKAEYHAAWGVLGQNGITREKLVGILDFIRDTYGVPSERLNKVEDPKLVMIFSDAKAYCELKAKTAQLKPVIAQKPAIPQQRQPIPQATRANKKLDARFKSGKANTRDLGAFLLMNGG